MKYSLLKLKPASVKDALLKTGRVINTSRKIITNLIFIVIVAIFLSTIFVNNTPKIAETTALVIIPNGKLVEQLTEKSLQQKIDDARGNGIRETLLKDVIDAINTARNDDRIKVLVFDLDSFDGAHLSKLQDVAKAINHFKTSGKKVIAMADSYGQNAYYIAAHADEIITHSMGGIILEGFGGYRMYYKDAIDKLGLDVHVFKVGSYKSAVEPFLLNNMSDFAKEAREDWLGDLWQIYLKDVATAREMTPEAINEYAQALPQFINHAKGDTAKAALDFGLIDHTMSRIEMRQYLIDLVGENKKTHSYNNITHNSYLKTIKKDRFGHTAKGDKVAVIVARGVILNGTQPAGTIGGDSTAALIRKAREDEDVKAIVLRVDSGGGSVFASEVIRHEAEQARADGKPVISSMGSVAASGGFWISTSTDQIWAHPSTITGSIGIYGLFASYQRPLAEHLGIHIDGYSTAPIKGIRPDRALPEEAGKTIQRIIEHGYHKFLLRVADSRKMTIEDVDKVAQGRVWSGIDAYKLGLVDNLGDLEDAINAAAKLAKLEDYTVSYIEKKEAYKDKLLRELMDKIVGISVKTTSPTILDNVLGRIKKAAKDIMILNDPNHAYALSNIETD